MFKRILLLVLSFLAVPAMGQSPQLAANELLPNLLINYNPGFENGLQRWTKAGSSTFTQTTTAANVAFGNAAASWTPGAANDTLTSTQITVPSGLFGRMCMGSAWVKASDGVTTFQVINGSSTVQASAVLSSQSTYTRYQVAFTCPSSGTLAVQLKASGAGAAVLLDQVYLGATLEMPVVDFNETTTPGNPVSGKLRVYGKSDNNLYFLNSSGTEQQVGSGSGQKNYIQTSANTAAGWTASSSNITVTTDTTVADLPRPQTTKSAVVFTGVSGSTDYGFVNFTLDPSDYNVKQQVSFSQACGLSGAASAIANCAASNFKVDVYSCTVAWSGSPATTCSGTSTRLPLSTDSSSISALPAATGQYRTTFDAPGSAAQYLQLRVGLNAATTHAIALSDVVVGPGVVTQGAAVSPPQPATFTGTWVSNTTYTAEEQRIGQWAFYQVKLALAGAPTSANLALTMPTGRTIDTTALVNTVGNSSSALPHNRVLILDSGVETFSGVAAYTNTTTIGIYYDLNSASPAAITQAAVTQAAPHTFKSGDTLTISFAVPIAEWAGAGTVNVASNTPIYYYSSGNTWGTTNSSATTSIGQGGVLGGTSTPAGTSFYYLFTPTSPIPVGAKPVLEVSPDGVHFGPVPGAGTGSGIIEALRNDGTNYIGAGVFLTSGGQIQAFFGKYAYGASGTWNGTWYWRVVVGQPSDTNGFSIYQANGTNGAGLVPSSGFPGGKSSDSNLGTITSVNLTAYYEGTFDTLWNSGGLSQHVTARYTRAGNMVTIFFPTTSVFTGSGTVAATAAIPSALLNSAYGSEVDFPLARLINGGTTGATGILKVDFTTGTMTAQASGGGAFSGANSQILAFVIAYPIN